MRKSLLTMRKSLWRMIGRTRGLLVVLSSVVLLALPAAASGAKNRAVERDWSGPTSASAGVRDLSFLTLSGTKKGARIPFKVKAWGMGAPVTCTGPEAPYSGYQLFPGFVGAVGDVSFPGDGRGGKLRVRKGRFSEHAVYNVVVYGIPKRIEYTVTGRFTSPRNATGTLQVSTLWSHPDGSLTSCVSGALTWSACAWNTGRFQGPPCAGIDPVDAQPTDPDPDSL